MRRVFGGFLTSQGREVWKFRMQRHILPRDAAIFKSEVTARSIRVKMRLYHFHRGVPADIAIELSVKRVAGVPDHIRPNLPARLYIAGKNRDAVLTNHRCVHTEARTRVSV